MAPSLAEIKIEDIDFDKVKECSDKKVLKRYIQLLEEDGSYFEALLKAAKDRLLEVAPKDYYLLYPRVASDNEVLDAMKDIFEWEQAVKETDAALLRSKKTQILDDASGRSRAPIRGQEPTVARPNVQNSREQPRLADGACTPSERDQFARDKAKMKDYYGAWDRYDADAMEAKLEEQEREEEEARRKHFDDLRDEQERAHTMTPVDVGRLPDNVPEAHRKHLADSEKEKGNEAFYSKDWEEAEAYYSRSLHFRGDDPSTWANRALVRLRLERPAGALGDCDRALEYNPRYMKALHRRGKALHELKRYEEAVKSFQLALSESPGNTQINGDLMVARRMLRREPDEPSPAPRRPDAPSTCHIEEIMESDVEAGSEPPAGYTRVMIEEDSGTDSEEEEHALRAEASKFQAGGSSPSSSRGFHRVVIEDVSGSSEDESEDAPDPGVRGARAAAPTPATAPSCGAGPVAAASVLIEDVSATAAALAVPLSSTATTKAVAVAAPAAAPRPFEPPPREPDGAAVVSDPAAVCFDDMD